MSDRRLVVFVAANEAGARTGNERTLQRLARRLEESGVDTVILRPGHSAAEVASDRRLPALVHALHARRSGPRAVDLSERLDVPLVVGLTGTDLAVDIFVRARAPIVTDVLRRAAAVTCGNPDEARTVARLVDPAPPCFVLPKGTPVPARLPPPTIRREPGEQIVLLVAHVRPVKNVALAVRVVRRLAEERSVRLVVLGDVLDPKYAAKVARDAGGPAAWDTIRHAAVPPEDVPGYLASADVVLNTSHAEGGSNAVLEAMALGKVVVASAVPGNVAYVGRDGTRGRTYPVRISDEGAAPASTRCARCSTTPPHVSTWGRRLGAGCDGRSPPMPSARCC
jgi:glycosyltransferase involved in cell wall biosynthesis